MKLDDDDGWDYLQDDTSHGDWCDCGQCKQDRTERECGELPADLGGGCQLAGTEHCDWDCPNHERIFGKKP